MGDGTTCAALNAASLVGFVREMLVGNTVWYTRNMEVSLFHNDMFQYEWKRNRVIRDKMHIGIYQRHDDDGNIKPPFFLRFSAPTTIYPLTKSFRLQTYTDFINHFAILSPFPTFAPLPNPFYPKRFAIPALTPSSKPIMLFDKDPLHLILLNAGAATHEGDWNWNDISSPFYRIYLVKEGEAWVNIGGKQYSLKPDHLYLIPPFTLHSDSNTGHFKLVYFHVYEETLRHVSLIEQLVLPVEVKATELDVLLVDRLLDINPGKGLPMYDPKGYDNSSTLMKSLATSTQTAFPVNAETYGILWQLFARFLSFAEQREPTRDSRIQGVTKYIREHIDQNMSISELAAQCYLSDDHFIRIFRKEMHQTPVDFINRKKIEKAQLLLVVENRPIKDIACALSFDNVSYFNRLFKKLVGKTPGDYRKSPY